MAIPLIRELAEKYYSAYYADLGAASSAFFVAAGKGRFTALYVVPNAALTGANAVITIKKNGTSTGVTVTVPFSGSGPGVGNELPLSSPVDVVQNDVIELASDGGPTNGAAVPAYCTAVVREDA